MKVILAMVLLTAVSMHECEGKTFTRCSLVRELRKQRFPESQIRNYPGVSLIEAESSLRTHIIGRRNSNGSRDHGLFQVNDMYWCNNSNRPGKDCNTTCAQLRTNDIRRASMCAKKIFQRHGFNAWYGWINKCKGKPLPSIKGC